MNFSLIQTIENTQEVSGFSLIKRLKFMIYSGQNVAIFLNLSDWSNHFKNLVNVDK